MKTIIAVFVKELLEFIRDSRSVIITLLIPFLLFPIVFSILGHKSERSYIVYVRDNSVFAEQLAENENLEVRDAAKLSAAELLQQGDVVVEGGNGDNPQFVITVNNRAKRSIEAGAMMEKMFQSGSGASKTECLYDEVEARSYLFLSFLLPVLFSVIAVNAPSTAAGHLMGGEKERSTLEAIWGTLAPRYCLVTGKYAATCVIGLLASMAYFGGLFLAYSLNVDISPGALTLLTIRRVLLLCVLYCSLIALTSSIELMISTFSSSSREALLSILPLTVLFLALSYYAQDLGSIPVAATFVPVVNFSLAVRDVIAGTVQSVTIFRVISLNILASIPFYLITIAYSRSEKVIYR